MPTTTNYALRYPVLTDTANGPRDLGYLAADIDAALLAVQNSLNTTAWTAPTLTNSWANFGAGTVPAGYRLAGDRVELRGVVMSGTAAVAMFTLPTGYRPSLIHLFSVFAGPGGARLDVGADGIVTLRSYFATGNNSMVSLCGVSFSITT